MPYFIAAALILLLARPLAGSWRKALILPWVVVTTPMLLGAGLANLHFLPTLIVPWSPRTHELVTAGTIALAAGSISLRNSRSPLVVSAQEISWNAPMLLKVLSAVTVTAFTATFLEFMIAGQVPMFSSDPDHARTMASRYGVLHVFSVLSGHVIPIASLILMTGKDLSKGARRMLALIIAVNFLLLLLWVARGMLLYPLLTTVAVYYILNQKSFTLKKFALLAVLLLLIVSGVKYLRDAIRFGSNVSAVQQGPAISGIRSGVIGNAAIAYLTIALNYEILNRYTATVPSLVPHSHGRIMSGNLTAYLPGRGVPYTELDLQNTILKKNEYDLTLTSTFFGIPYLEFGLPGVILFSFAVGLLYRTVWLRMLDSGSTWYLFLYGYLISMAAFIPYTFLFTQVSFTWFILSSYPIMYLCACRTQGESLWHRRNRVWFQCGKARPTPRIIDGRDSSNG